MNRNMARLLTRLETTTIPRVEGQLRAVRDGEECMCPLGHLVDLYIQDTPGAKWLDERPHYYQDPNYDEPGAALGFPAEEVLKSFGLDAHTAYLIYQENDYRHKTPAEVAEFIRAELI